MTVADATARGVHSLPLSLDLSAPQQARHDALLRRLSEPQRSALVAGLWEAGRQLAEAGVRARHPGASPALVRWLLTEVLSDAATAERLHGARPAA